jgi:hypothetical protein
MNDEYVFLNRGESDDELRDAGIIDDEHDVAHNPRMSEEAAIRYIEHLPAGVWVSGAIFTELLSPAQYAGLTAEMGFLTGLMTREDFLSLYRYAKQNFPE